MQVKIPQSVTQSIRPPSEIDSTLLQEVLFTIIAFVDRMCKKKRMQTKARLEPEYMVSEKYNCRPLQIRQ